MGFVFALGVLGVIGAAGCKGDQGATGPAGTSCTVTDNGNGTKTITCADGTRTTVSDGQAGGSCIVQNTDAGSKVITCADGTTVTVNDGRGCTVVDNGNGTKTITCADGTTVTVSNGPPGTSVATINLHLVDADSGADVIGAEILANPGNITVTTNSSGRATFASLPVGVYQFEASAPGLKLVGNTVVEDTVQTVTTVPISIVAGATITVDFQLRRIDRNRLNLVSLHAGGNAAYTIANCKACHNDRKNELSTDATKPPWHALTTHADSGCTTCHQTVDLVLASGASIRKQVNVTLCKGCHPSYPASF